jgi:large subunit ribosomal protein L15
MASKRPISELSRFTFLRPSLRCPHLRAIPQCQPQSSPFTTTPPTPLAHHDTDAAPRPRWQHTPARMVAPFRTRPKPEGPEYVVNSDPRRLDDVYVRFLGKDGDKVLSEEVKWLAVTHKSFDHGRRGFNDRLALLGRSCFPFFVWGIGWDGAGWRSGPGD